MVRLLLLLSVLFLNGCATPIADFEACSPIPGIAEVSCDWFLHSDPQTLTDQQWSDLQAQWLSQGLATECINSDALGSIKSEIEDLCSRVSCDEETKDAIIAGIERIQMLGLK